MEKEPTGATFHPHHCCKPFGRGGFGLRRQSAAATALSPRWRRGSTDGGPDPKRCRVGLATAVQMATVVRVPSCAHAASRRQFALFFRTGPFRLGRTFAMALKLFNTLTRAVQDFAPLDPGGKKVGMYCCGPTVYDFGHIGNFRTFLFSDLVRRYLEYRGYDVQHVMNIT